MLSPAPAVKKRTDLRVEALIALLAAECLMGIAAIVAASTRRFADWYPYLVAAVVIVGLAVAVAIALLP